MIKRILQHFSEKYFIRRNAELEKENARLRGWLEYIKESDSSVVPNGMHENSARDALDGLPVPTKY